MSVPDKKVDTNVTRVGSVLSCFDYNMIKVKRYSPIEKNKVKFNKHSLTINKQSILPLHVPEEILQECQQLNKSLTKRYNRKIYKRPKKLPQARKSQTVYKNENLQEIQTIKAEIDKMENKLIFKKKVASKQVNNSSKSCKTDPKVNMNIEKLDQNNKDYDPNDYTDENEFISPTTCCTLAKSSEDEFYLNKLRSKCMISDKLPFELGTKISPTDSDAILKLREQLKKLCASTDISLIPSEKSTPTVRVEENDDAARLPGMVVVEQPERDNTLSSRSSSESDKSASSIANKNYPLDKYLKHKNKIKENHRPIGKRFENTHGLVYLQEKAFTLAREVNKQLETPLSKPTEPSDGQLSASGSESGRTEELVETVFKGGTCNQGYHRSVRKQDEHQRHVSKFDLNSSPHCIPPHSKDLLPNSNTSKSCYSCAKNIGILLPPNLCPFHNNGQLDPSVGNSCKIFIDSAQHADKARANIDVDTECTNKVASIHWSSNLEKECKKLDKVKEMHETYQQQKKTHDVSVNTEIPKINTKFIRIQSKDNEVEEVQDQKIFQIQELPIVNIRPQLTKQTCSIINIVSSKKSKKTRQCWYN